MKKIEGKQGHVLQTDVGVNMILYLIFTEEIYVCHCLSVWLDGLGH